MFWFILSVIGAFGLVDGYIAGRAGVASQARRLPEGDRSERDLRSGSEATWAGRTVLST
ncbi:MAG: hypothetical protein QGG24_09410 [Vicinamibacterales bacterium]|jgi:hypothetical protein|nr:hypothetical protein [Vicinamibacterales bacterium]|tara:strand:- start:30 stop:206 length:177 start_codon:yes stop_codon:yes gene_type:complete